MTPRLTVTFQPSGRGRAQCAANPAFPDGVAVDASTPGAPSCETALPYPAPECGVYCVRCETCGLSAGITAAGRADDPRSLRVPCLLPLSQGESVH